MLKLKSVNFDQRQFQSHQLTPAYQGQVEWLIGRNPTCDLVLSNREVSRVHGRIIYHADAYHFVDVGSTSGSLLNGDSVPVNDKRLLHVGDLLQIGETFLYVEELASPIATTVNQALSSQHSVKLPELQWSEEALTCYCDRIIQETPDIKTFCFRADPAVLFTFHPGQFVNLEVVLDGKPVIRPYSISSSPTRPYHLSLTIKRVPSPENDAEVPPGVVSNWMHDEFQVGDRVRLIGGAMGHFSCLPNLPTKLLLISAGSGITPMISMSRWMYDSLVDCDVVFLHSARTPKDIPFRAELEMMAAQMPNFQLAITTTQWQPGEAWMGLTGRISESMLQWVVPDLPDRAVYVCGPAGFMAGVKSTLEAMQFPMKHYLEESFGGRKLPPSQATAEAETPSDPPTFIGDRSHGYPVATQADAIVSGSIAPAVNFAKAEQVIATDGTLSILEVAEQEGISIPSACRAGACGACKLRTRAGTVRYATPPAALTAKDEQAGYVLACVAHPVDQVVVEA
ncbi:MAG: FHA domain-containing protein [Leptolyngbyaceae cyanobacterium bins.302]|nr:FHA domain-containing protein [Leptolyngbyaceae cyanobacterium bins.302]